MDIHSLPHNKPNDQQKKTVGPAEAISAFVLFILTLTVGFWFGWNEGLRAVANVESLNLSEAFSLVVLGFVVKLTVIK